MTIPHIEILVPAVVGGATLIAMTFTPADIVTVLAAVGVLVGIIATAVINIMAARMKAVGEKVDLTLEKTTAIEHATNSAASKAEGIIAGQATQLEMQRTTITELKRTAELLAQAQSSRDAMKDVQKT